MDLKAKVKNRRRAKAKAAAKPKPAKRRRADSPPDSPPRAGRIIQKTAWDAGSWAPVAKPDEFWAGEDHAACLSLEELPGSSYAALRRGEAVAAPAEAEAEAEAEADAGYKREAWVVTPDVGPDAVAEVKRQWCPGAGLALRDELFASLARLAFDTPTPCQAACVPKVLRGKDVVCAAQTGSGKTLAFALPALHDALNNEGGGVRTLILAPTRELAQQIAVHACAALPRSVDAKRVVCAIVGGLAEQKQERMLALCPAIVVATPGRLRELIEDGKAHHVRAALEERTLRFLILDEADRLLAPGAFGDLTLLTKRFLVDHKDRPRRRWQTLVFSATLACGAGEPKRQGKGKRQTDADPRALLAAIEPLRAPARKLEVVDLTRREAAAPGADGDGAAAPDGDGGAAAPEDDGPLSLPPTLALEAVRVVDAAKLATCYALLRGGAAGRIVVFANAISSVKTVAAALQKLRVARVQPLHAALQQRQRLRALDAFAKHNDAVLVATDVAARGLDVEGVALVVHYDVAPSFKLFVHRAGRTARAGRAGRSVSLVAPRDAARHAGIEAALGTPFVARTVDAAVVAAAADRATLAKKHTDAERDAARDRAGRDWTRRAAASADLLLDDDEAEAVSADYRGAGAPMCALPDESHVSRPKRRMAVVGPDTLRMLAEERARGDGARPQEKKTRKRRKRK